MEALKQFHVKATNGKKSWEMDAHSMGTIKRIKEALDALGVTAVVTDQIEEAVKAEVERRLAEAEVKTA